MKKSLKEKRNFSSFEVKDAMRCLGLSNLEKWKVDFKPLKPTDFYHERVKRLEEYFDLNSTERAKELLIEATFEDAITHHSNLRFWKSAPLQSEELKGEVDYLLAPKRRYLDTPFLCVIEAKKDDFEKGLAQCLVEMKACRWNNEQSGLSFEVYGIVTNGTGWVFYRYNLDGTVFETEMFALSDLENVLGILSYLFGKCEENL